MKDIIGFKVHAVIRVVESPDFTPCGGVHGFFRTFLKLIEKPSGHRRLDF